MKKTLRAELAKLDAEALQALFAWICETHAEGREMEIEDWLEELGVGSPSTSEELAEFVETVFDEVEAVAGAKLGPTTVYAVPGYGWDGGNAIDTETWNLDELTENWIFSGPGASVAVRRDPSFPGAAIHHYYGDSESLFQLFV